MSLPEDWQRILWDNVLLYRTLGEKEQDKLRADTLALCERLFWEGCRGQEITDEVKVTIAGQASLLLLGLKGYRFDELQTALVYPGSFLVSGDDEFEGPPEIRMGEAAEGGPVVLSWWHSLWAGRQLGQTNVVLHEFAHKMAELGDAELGMPPFVSGADAKKWKKVMLAARRRLEEDDLAGEDTLMDPYGAESLSEFFAVATETFFLQPRELRADMPAVYNLLSSCYRQDPASRAVPPELEELSRGAEQEYNRQAVKEYTAAIRLRPGQAELFSLRSGYREALGDVEGAMEDLREAARLAGDVGSRLDALYDLADLLEDQGRLDEADEVFREAERLGG